MKSRPRFTALFLAGLLIFSPGVAPVSLHAAEESPTFTPPWTQEKIIPKEVKDKEKEKPAAWCKKFRKNDTVEETTVTYADGTVIRYTVTAAGPITQPDPVITSTEWTITKPGPKGKTKITYNTKDKTRTVEEPGKEKVKEDWKEAKDAALLPCGGTCNPTPAPNANPPAPNPTQPKKGTWLFPSDSTRLVNVAFPAYSRAAPASRETPVDSRQPAIFLAATGEQPRPPDSQSQGKVVILNLKIVTNGDPPAETVVFFDPGPRTTPEEFMNTPPTEVTWNPKRDGDGPRTTRPGPTGTPITEIIPGSGIYIGWGWTSGYVDQSTAEECGGGNDDADLQEAKRLTELAKNAREGGPEYWRKKAQTEEANAKRAEREQRGRAKDAALERAKQDKETADELQRRGVADKPDPKLPKNQRDDIDKQRADAIKKITDEAAEHTRKASAR
jgi:hypothetical protein